jgi:hypothetical protein
MRLSGDSRFWRRVSERLNLPLDKVMTYDDELETIKEERQAANSSNEESRQKLYEYLVSLNGNLTPDIPASDICAGAGVPHNRGNAMYAVQTRKRLLLTFRDGQPSGQ